MLIMYDVVFSQMGTDQIHFIVWGHYIFTALQIICSQQLLFAPVFYLIDIERDIR
jgi:hypothetical protein